MATWTDRTSFRVLDEDGQIVDEHGTISNGYGLEDFSRYTARQDQSSTIAQWYVVSGDHEGDILAEASEAAGVVVYPAASIFV